MQTPVALTGRPRSVVGEAEGPTAQERDSRRGVRVALVSMPFVAAYLPSMQLGLLKPLAEAHGFPTDAFHLYLDLAGRLGLETYDKLGAVWTENLGEWLFSPSAYGDQAPDLSGRGYVTRFREKLLRAQLEPADVLEVRNSAIPEFMDELVAAIPWDQYRVVGFTSTFQQNVASIALSRRLKQRDPELITLFGGANFEGDMGLEHVRATDCIDYAITGEADVSFPQFLIALSEGTDPGVVGGVLRREAGSVAEPRSATPFDRLDELPLPDYDDYFERATRFGLLPPGARRNGVALPFEGSRGCWWGERRHCTFCGLNGQTMSYRTKSPGRVLAELNSLSQRYHSFTFQAVDNIMDKGHLDDLLPALAENDRGYRIFFEIKANLSRDDVRCLGQGGINKIQPGIESLSSRVLGLMRKGVRASQNVNLLRWARHYGIDVLWNLLYGFPTEEQRDYDEQADLIPSLAHLQPPGGAGRIWLERFSPNFTDDVSFPKRWFRPEESFRYVYPETVDLDRAVYFFDYEFVDTNPDSMYEPVVSAVEQWNKDFGRSPAPSLTVWSGEDHLLIEDQRYADGGLGTYTVEGANASVYRACMDRPRTLPQIAETCDVVGAEDQLSKVLDDFVTERLMMRDGNLFLSLALPPPLSR